MSRHGPLRDKKSFFIITEVQDIQWAFLAGVFGGRATEHEHTAAGFNKLCTAGDITRFTHTHTHTRVHTHSHTHTILIYNTLSNAALCHGIQRC